MDGVKDMVRTAVKTLLLIALLALCSETLAWQDTHPETAQEYPVISNGHYVNPSYLSTGKNESCLGCYRSDCGRGITSFEAVDLWRGYCNEDCTMDRQSQGCGFGHCGRCCGNLRFSLHAAGCCRPWRGVHGTIMHGKTICPSGCDR